MSALDKELCSLKPCHSLMWVKLLYLTLNLGDNRFRYNLKLLAKTRILMHMKIISAICGFACTTYPIVFFVSLIPLFPSNVSQLIPSYHFPQFPNAAPLLRLQNVRSETLTTSPNFPEPLLFAPNLYQDMLESFLKNESGASFASQLAVQVVMVAL